MKRYLIPFLFLVISILCFSSVFAQEKQKIPADFFIGKWGGTISGEIVMSEEHYPFHLELTGNSGKNTAQLKLNAVRLIMDENGDYIQKPITVFDHQAPYAIYFKLDPPVFTINFSQDFGKRLLSLGFNTFAAYQLAFVTGFKIEPKNEKLFLLISREQTLAWGSGGHAKGELHRIYTRKDTLGKTIQINEPIKTDKFTQREVVVPVVSETPKFPYEIGKVYVFGNTDCIFTSENKMVVSSGEVVIFENVNWKNIDINKIISSKPEISDIDWGELTTKLDKLKEEGEDFRVRTPQAVLAARGTQFITKVKDNTTILTVLDGEVEFSDINKKKTVIVKKNHKSICKRGGLPTEPVLINPAQIQKWWQEKSIDAAVKKETTFTEEKISKIPEKE